MSKVLVFRREILPLSETFILSQVLALQRYTPLLVGLRRATPSLPINHPPLVLAEHRAGRLRAAIVMQGGVDIAFTRALRLQRASLVHAHFSTDAALCLPWLRSLRLPIVATLHGYDVMLSDHIHRQSHRGRLFLRRRRLLWAYASRFLCVSDAICEQALRQGYPSTKLVVCPIGIDASSVAPIEQLSRGPIVLFVGRLVPKKGCALLLQAFARLQHHLPHARLHIVGDGPERASLEAAARSLTLGAVFHGSQTSGQVEAHMRSARCIAAPSITAEDGDAEGLPTVLLEACALGLPVVSTLHSGIPELIEHGTHGLLATEGDIDELAAHLLSVCTQHDLAERLRWAARARVEQHFSLQLQTARLEALYDEVREQNLLEQETLATL